MMMRRGRREISLAEASPRKIVLKSRGGTGIKNSSPSHAGQEKAASISYSYPETPGRCLEKEAAGPCCQVEAGLHQNHSKDGEPGPGHRG
jgi:hypothetical protein